MQSGTTGMNTVRLYSPTKQARDQDPEGHFIRRWVPELARVPLAYLAEPWTMPEAVQRMAGCILGIDYPPPLVDEKAAMRTAKERIYAVRKSPEARGEADAIVAQHGSRKPPTTARNARSQTDERKGRNAGGKAAAQATGRMSGEGGSPAPDQGDLFAE